MGWTEREEVWGESLDEIRKTLNWMLECLDKPVLDEADLLRQVEEARGEESSGLFSEPDRYYPDADDEPTVSFDSVEDFLAELDRYDLLFMNDAAHCALEKSI